MTTTDDDGDGDDDGDVGVDGGVVDVVSGQVIG